MIRGVAGVLVREGEILLVKRKYGSKKGSWCIPCGKVEEGEALEGAVVREFLEETHLEAAVVQQIYQVHATHRRGVPYEGTWFELHCLGGVLQADDDAEEAAFFPRRDLPEMAFADDVYVIDEILGLV